MGWKMPVNFQTLHYAYIIACSVLGLIILYPYGNLEAVDAFFFGASGSTESGLNTVDVKDLKIYQQLFIYFIPIVTNLGFINIMVVVVRLYWFKKHLKDIAPSLLRNRKPSAPEAAIEGQRHLEPQQSSSGVKPNLGISSGTETATTPAAVEDEPVATASLPEGRYNDDDAAAAAAKPRKTHIAFGSQKHPRVEQSKTLYIPPPGDREKGKPIVELDDDECAPEDDKPIAPVASSSSSRPHLPRATSVARIADVASSMFIIGATTSQISRPRHPPGELQEAMSFLSSQATVGRNSQFHNLTSKDREELGGIEYRSLKLLLKIVVAYFFGLHIIGAICLIAWTRAQPDDNKYMQWLLECGQDKIWWAFYSAQTMVNNLGFTLTPDSMITFRDAIFPMLVMSFLAFAGNTFYPIFLRCGIWVMSKLVPKKSSLKDPLEFLLKHPRRCYTLLFPSKPTWILFTILCILNIVDIILIITLDLDNPTLNDLPMGPRVLAAIFQAASSRHTGTSTFNLATVNPAVQFSLLIMMYIAVYPIAISIRASNIYEERALGVYQPDPELDENTSGRTYFLRHLQNQLSFDLWYIFLGIFCICVAESDKIMDPNKPSFAVFPIFFEVVSAYGNVGLSLGDPSVYTSLCGLFRPFSKIVICLMMIRGRHRGLPYQLDNAIILPRDQLEEAVVDEEDRQRRAGNVIKRETVGRVAAYKTV